MASRAHHGQTWTVDPKDLSPPLGEVKDYWAAKRGARAMPRRADIDPLELRAHMPYLSMLEVLPDSADFLFRLLGTGITERLGRDSTGKTVRQVYTVADPAIRKWMLDGLQAVVAHKAPVLMGGTLRMVQKDFLRFQTLHLPLSEDGERVSMLFGCTDFPDRDPRKG
jgi:hypothetical protein